MDEKLLLKLQAAIASQSFEGLTQTEIAKLADPEFLGKVFGKEPNDEKTQQLVKIMQENLSALEGMMSDYYKTPEGQTLLKEAMRKKAKGRLSEAASEGLDFLASFAEIGTSIRGIAETEKDLRGVVPPTAPQIPGASPELAEATDMARQRAYNPYSSAEVNALLGSQALDTLKGLQTAKSVSGGQASQYQGMAQDVLDRSRYAKIQASNTLREGQRQAETDYLRAAGAKSQEAMQRASLQQGLYGLQSRNYMFDKGLADAALSAQRGNLMTAIQNATIRLPEAIGGGLARMYNTTPRYTGMGATVDTQDQAATTALNRLRNQQLMQQTMGITTPQFNENALDYYNAHNYGTGTGV